MRRFVLLCEELEARPADGDRVSALARWFAEAGRDEARTACELLLPSEGHRRAVRGPRIRLHALREAARAVASRQGMPDWVFEAGVQAAGDPAEGIALTLPSPLAPAAGGSPGLGDWLAAWRAAAAAEDEPARALGVVQAVTSLDDAPSRRWALRAAAGLTRPQVRPWQWMRAWCLAFGDDLHSIAWRWHAHGRAHALHAVDPLQEDVPAARAEASRSRDLPAGIDAAALVARGERWLEPRWRGEAVRLVRRGDHLAIWHRSGELVNARLQPDLLAVEPWPDPAVVEAVLFGWAAGRAVSPWLDEATLRGRGAGRVTQHLVVTDWLEWGGLGAAGRGLEDRRRALRRAWPEYVVDRQNVTPPRVFTTGRLRSWDEAQAVLVARGLFEGVLLRPAAPRLEGQPEPDLWHREPPPREVRALLQYVPAEALAAGGARALRSLPCGLAVWNRAPASEEEAARAATRSLDPAAVEGPDAARLSAQGLPVLRLLPLARVLLALSDEQAGRLHDGLTGHAGPRFGGMTMVLPRQVIRLRCRGWSPARRLRVGVALEGVQEAEWLEGEVRADDVSIFGRDGDPA